MKRTRFGTLSIFAFAIFLLTAFQTLHAQQTFKVGDRVMVSPTGLKDEKYWRPGTITEVHNFSPKKAYSVTCDPQSPGGHSSAVLVNQDWIRPLNDQKEGEAGNNNNQAPNDQPPLRPANQNQNQNQTQHQNHNQNQNQNQAQTQNQNQNNKVACPPSDPDSKGATAFERSIRGAIRTGFEREPQLNEDGRVTVTFQNVNIGRSHAWHQLEDPIDARGRTIYEVRSAFTTCTDYNRRIELTKRERAFACYKNNAGEWVCEVVAATNTNIKDQTKSIDKPHR